MPRQCPFNGCATEIADVLFSCSKHWRSLSYDQKRLINDAYFARGNGDIDEAEAERRCQFVLDQVQPRNLFNQGKP